MSNAKEFRDKRAQCQDAYITGKTDPVELATTFGVSHLTVRKWIKDGSWAEILKEEATLDKRIATARKKAILTALREFEKKPADVALQSLVSLLRNEQRRLEPIKELNDYIVKFMDQLTDFCIEKGYQGLLTDIQKVTHDLAEYLRVRNG